MLSNYLKNHKNINEVMELKQTLLECFSPFHVVKSEIMLCLEAKIHAIKTKVIIYIVAPSVNYKLSITVRRTNMFGLYVTDI